MDTESILFSIKSYYLCTDESAYTADILFIDYNPFRSMERKSLLIETDAIMNNIAAKNIKYKINTDKIQLPGSH